MSNEIILFENQDVKLEVNMKDETVWLTQAQMAKLFQKSKSTINEHIKNIYRFKELEERETMTKFGNSEFSDKAVNYYNLDLIAESNPKEKEILIDLIMNLIVNNKNKKV